jgi:hypothetical protein
MIIDMCLDLAYLQVQCTYPIHASSKIAKEDFLVLLMEGSIVLQPSDGGVTAMGWGVVFRVPSAMMR